MEEINSIPVLVLGPRRSLTGRQALPEPEDLAERVMNVPIAKLKESINRATVQVAELVSELPATEGKMRLDEISVGLAVSASGEVRLVAGIGVEVGTTITLTYKVADDNDNGAF